MHKNSEKLHLLLLVLGLRSSLFLVELGVGIWSYSLSLIAGSWHVFSDLVSLGMTLIVTWLLQGHSVNKVNFQYRRVETWVALLNSLSLVFISILITIEAIEHLQHPEPISGLPMLIVAGISIVVNGITIYLLHSDSHHDLNVRGIFLHGVADTASSIGVLLSAIAIYYLNWLWADAIISLLVVTFLSLSAISLIWDSLQTMRIN